MHRQRSMDFGDDGNLQHGEYHKGRRDMTAHPLCVIRYSDLIDCMCRKQRCHSVAPTD